MNKEQQQAYNGRRIKARKWAHKIVGECIDNPTSELFDNPTTMIAAEFCFDDQPSHQYYWNDRFAIAVGCQLTWENRQQVAAWVSVNNGLNGYWEWTTHSRYDLTKILKRLGIVPEDFNGKTEHDRFGLYVGLDRDIGRKIAEYFDLPTTHFGNKTELSDTEKEMAKWFNAKTYFRTL